MLLPFDIAKNTVYHKLHMIYLLVSLGITMHKWDF